MIKNSLVVVCAFVVLGAIAVPRAAGACQNDSECKDDRVCYDGNCVSPATAAELEKIAVEKAATAPAPAPAPAPTAAPQTVYVAPAPPPAPPAPAIVDDQAEVEAALGRSVESQHTYWLRSRTTRFPVFSDYMYNYYRGKKSGGVVMAAVLGPVFLVVGAGVSIPLIVAGNNVEMCDWEDGDYDCHTGNDGMIIAGSVIAGAFGTASIIFIIAGAAKAGANGGRAAKVGALKKTALAEPALEFKGVAAMVDREKRPAGLALQWTF